MIRSRLAVAGLLVVVVAILVAKAAMSPKAHAQAKSPGPAYAAERPVAPTPAEKGAELTGADLEQCLKDGKPTLADFGEGWCEQCKKMVPVLAAATKQYKGTANVVFVDTKAYGQHAQTYGIVRIPTQIFFDASGKEVSRHIGYYPLPDVSKKMGKLVNSK